MFALTGLVADISPVAAHVALPFALAVLAVSGGSAGVAKAKISTCTEGVGLLGALWAPVERVGWNLLSQAGG